MFMNAPDNDSLLDEKEELKQRAVKAQKVNVFFFWRWYGIYGTLHMLENGVQGFSSSSNFLAVVSIILGQREVEERNDEDAGERDRLGILEVGK